MTATATPLTVGPDDLAATAEVTRVRRRRARRRRVVIAALSVAVVGVVATTLVYGRTVYPLGDVVAVLMGQEVPGASFTVGRLRLPRVVLALVTGISFGLGGITFQTMLRNPLASPDIIGISSGASTAAAFAIVVLSMSGPAVSVVAIIAGVGVAVAVYGLASGRGAAGTRLVLVGIGVAAMLNSVTTWVITQAGQWDHQLLLRWLSGSLNGAAWAQVVPAAVALAVLAPLLLSRTRDLGVMQLGDDAGAALGVHLERTRVVVVVVAVGLIAFAIAAAGPIAFVAFLSGPIAARLVGPNGSLLVPAALVGALLVTIADLAGQFAFGTRFPVGVVTGVLGAPYLVYLIVRTNRAGGSL